MIIANEITIPDYCPIKCPGNKESFSQGGLCSNCPIFLCRKTECLDEEGKTFDFCVVEPECYRKDWAIEWSRWWNTDMKDLPNLMLMQENDNAK